MLADIERWAGIIAGSPEAALLLIADWSRFPGEKGPVTVGIYRDKWREKISQGWTLSIHRKAAKAFAAYEAAKSDTLDIFRDTNRPDQHFTRQGYDNGSDLPF